MKTRGRTVCGTLLAAAATFALLASAADARVAKECRGLTPAVNADYDGPGSYPVGVQTFTFVDASRPTDPNNEYPGAPDRTLVTEVWYPATVAGRDAPVDVAGGPYPVVIQSHGFLDSRIGESYVTEHLASRGYIVAALDYPLSNGGAPGGATISDIHNQPGDWSFVLDNVLVEFAAAADADSIGASGLSLGGLTTWLVTYHPTLRDPRIDAAVAMAAPACMFKSRFFRTTETPRLVLHGNSDQIVPYRQNGRRAFRPGPATRHLIELDVGSHTGFTTFAAIFDQSVHFDVIGCDAVGAGLGEVSEGDNPLGHLGGPGLGLKRNQLACPSPCEKPVPAGPSMVAARHHDLTQIGTAAFFDGYLKDDVDARCYLGEPLADQNDDADTSARGR